MRTKTKAVRRHSGGQPLVWDVSVGTDTTVVRTDFANNLNGCPLSSVVVEGYSGDVRGVVSDDGNWVGSLGVPADLGSFMEVDDRLQRVGVNVHTSVAGRPSNGITINEPHSPDVMVTNTYQRPFMDVDVTGKGQTKLDDVPQTLDDGITYFFFRLFSGRVCYIFLLFIFCCRNCYLIIIHVHFSSVQ